MLGNLLDFAGGLLSSRRQKRYHRDAMNLSREQFAAQMDESIQRRVKDAQAAGIHPLFAMGASVGASPTASVGGRSPSGSAVGDALSRVASRIAGSKLVKAQIRSEEASASRDEAEAAFINSQRARLTQEMGARGHDGASVVKTYPYPGGPASEEIAFGPPEYVNPKVATSKSVGIESGLHPGTIDVVLPDGRRVNIPSPNLGLDEIGQLDYAYQRAVHKGTDAMEWLGNKFKNRPLWKVEKHRGGGW